MDELKQIYKEAVDYLDERYAFFLTHVLNIGSPQWTEAIPTAAVAILKDEKDESNFFFIFNPRFAAEVLDGTEEVAFVLAHETMHIVLNHLKLGKTFKDEKKFNVAADCVINDYLVAAGLKGIEQGCYGEKVVGYNCAHSTVTQVYDDLTNEMMDALGGGGEGDGRGGFAFDDHGWLKDAPQEVLDAIDKVWEQMKDQAPVEMDDLRDDIEAASNLGGMLAGKSQGAEEAFLKQQGVTFAWADLLKEIDPDIFRHKGISPPVLPSFHQHRRKLMAFPDVRLPVTRRDPRHEDKSDQVPSIVMALDTSGSIAPDDRNRFISLAQSIPQERIKLFPCTFTTEFTPLDLENPRYHSGGTCFSAVEKYIRAHVISELGHYPSAVVVITDGCAGWDYQGNKPNDTQGENWFWLLTDYHQNPPPIGRKKPLREFTR